MLEDDIRRFIANDLSTDGKVETLADDYPLLEKQVLDSLALFQLVSYLESEFEIEVLDEELVPSNFGTIRDITRLVKDKRRSVGEKRLEA